MSADPVERLLKIAMIPLVCLVICSFIAEGSDDEGTGRLADVSGRVFAVAILFVFALAGIAYLRQLLAERSE